MTIRFPFFSPMPVETREVRPGPRPRQVLNEHGLIETVPAHWDLLPPGDAALSRRIKHDGASLIVIEFKGRKRFSRGIWAPSDRIAALRQELLIERQNPSHQKKLDASRRRRAQAQEAYAEEFRRAVLRYLDFHADFQAYGRLLADLIATHAVPVGSGTVARTERIPIEERAAAATIAWLRHQTTAYDHMAIPRTKGRRREIRRQLAQRSTQLLAQYRAGRPIDTTQCPLYLALTRATVPTPSASKLPR
jgi:hypothetical protein